MSGPLLSTRIRRCSGSDSDVAISFRSPTVRRSLLNVYLEKLPSWKASAIGRNSNSVREFLEKNYEETARKETIKYAIRALLEVVESGGENIEIAVMTSKHGLHQLDESEIDVLVAEIKAATAESSDIDKTDRGPPDSFRFEIMPPRKADPTTSVDP